MKSCTIKITNKGRELIQSALRGEHWVTKLHTVITDDETGRVLNDWTSHSAERDTLTFPVFYDETRVKEAGK